jgi:hypothetical protein
VTKTIKLINRDVAKRTGDYLDSKVKSGITTAATCNAALFDIVRITMVYIYMFAGISRTPYGYLEKFRPRSIPFISFYAGGK